MIRYFIAVMKRDPEKFDDPAFSNFSIEDTFHDIENKFDINRIKKFQIVRKHYVAFGLITDLDDITEDDLTTLKTEIGGFTSTTPYRLHFKEHQYTKKFDRERTLMEIYDTSSTGNLMFCAFESERCLNLYVTERKTFSDNEEMILTILESESSYGRKRKKSITSNRSAV